MWVRKVLREVEIKVICYVMCCAHTVYTHIHRGIQVQVVLYLTTFYLLSSTFDLLPSTCTFYMYLVIRSNHLPYKTDIKSCVGYLYLPVHMWYHCDT